LGAAFRIVYIYGPYFDKKPLWDYLSCSGFLESQNVILGEDMNFTLSLKEWERNPKKNSLE